MSKAAQERANRGEWWCRQPEGGDGGEGGGGAAISRWWCRQPGEILSQCIIGGGPKQVRLTGSLGGEYVGCQKPPSCTIKTEYLTKNVLFLAVTENAPSVVGGAVWVCAKGEVAKKIDTREVPGPRATADVYLSGLRKAADAEWPQLG